MTKSIEAPFIIRPHHLELFKDGVGSGSDLNRFSRSTITQIVTSNYGGDLGLHYPKDVMGKRYQGLQKFEAALTSFFVDYRCLYAEHPILIGPYLDRLCKTCEIGEHCTKTLVLPGYLEGEDYALVVFQALAQTKRKSLVQVATDVTPWGGAAIFTNKFTVQQVIETAYRRQVSFRPTPLAKTIL